MTAIDPGGVPNDPGWQLPTDQILAAGSLDEALNLLANNDAGDASGTARGVSPDRIAVALSVLPAGPVAASLIELCDPNDPSMSPLGRLRLIAATDRHTARLQARQDQWLASYARPGISASMEQLLDMACDGRRANAIAPWVAELIPLDIRLDPARFAAAVADLPHWQIALEQGAERAAAHEIGAVLGISPMSAGNRIREAILLVDDFPSTLEAQLAGRLDRLRARTITNTFTLLSDPDQRATAEHQAINDSGQFTPATFTNHCEHILILLDPDAAHQRAEEALAGRKTRRHCGIDGMGRFTADLPADKALLTAAVLDAAASRFPTTLRDGRTTDQLRADIFAGIFTNLAEHGHTDLRGHIPDTPPEADPADTEQTHDLQTEADSTAADDAPNDGAQNDDLQNDDLQNDTDNTENAPAATASPPPDDQTKPDPAPPPVFAPWSPCVALTVTIGASTLAGLDNNPGHLAGHGWIHADLARRLAESAATIRLAINREDTPHHQQAPGTPPDPQVPGDNSAHSDRPGHQTCHNDATCGGTLDHGRAVYRPPTATADYVTTRDRTCRHPGCQRPAENCDLDHRRPFDQGGPTCPCNLDPLCRSHHRAKTFLGWTAIRGPGNHLNWTTPHGYTTTDHPQPQPNGKPFTPTDLETALLYDPPPF